MDLSALSGSITVTYSGDEAGTITDGNDTLTRGDGNDTFVYTPGDGSDTITDFNAGNTGALDDDDSTNNDFIDLSGYYDSLSELHADQADDGVLNQANTTGANAGDYSNNTQFAPGEGITFVGASADRSNFTKDNTGVVCFTAGTLIHTPRGDVLVETLKVGDVVATMDNGPQPIRWIGRMSFDQPTLAAHQNLRPILIKADVLGNLRPLLVSPQHGMLIDRDHLARATHLAQTIKGIRVAHGRRHVTYIHMLFDTHQIVFAEGAPSESFYPGPTALRMMNNNTRRAVMSALKTLSNISNPQATEAIYGEPARRFAHKNDIATVFTKDNFCY